MDERTLLKQMTAIAYGVCAVNFEANIFKWWVNVISKKSHQFKVRGR